MQKKPTPPNINRNVWLLRQSKRFPGEYYCFNTANGEAMWCRSEDRPSTGKPFDNFQTNLMEDTNAYPEPGSPPHNYNIPNTTRTTFKPTAPTFGTVTFPTYLPQANNAQRMYTNAWGVPNNQKIFLTQAIPMFVPNYTNLDRVDRITQTSRSSSPVFVETTRVPINRRVNGHFDLSRTVSLGDNRNYNLKQFDMVGFTPISPARVPMRDVGVEVNTSVLRKGTISEDSEVSKKDDKPKEVFVKKRTVSYMESSTFSAVEIDKNIQAPSPNPTHKETIVGRLSQSTEKALSAEPAVAVITTAAQPPEEMTFVHNLAKDDLRYKLLAKRRKTGDSSGHAVQEKESTNTRDQAEPLNPAEIPVKKKVSFDFNNAQTDSSIHSEEIYEDREGTYAPSETPHTEYHTAKLRSLTGNHVEGKCWYIAADIAVLLNEFGFIENLVLSDQDCRLVVPTAVRSQLSRLSCRVAARQSRVLAARRLSRRLATAEFVVHEENQSSPNGADGIIECCKRYNVILITNQIALHTKASSAKIPCITLEKAKKMATELAPTHFEAKKIKITLKNFTATKEDTNLFLQNKIQAGDKEKRLTKEVKFNESSLHLPHTQQTVGKETPYLSRHDTASFLTITSDTITESLDTNWGIEDLDLRDKSPILQKVSSKVSNTNQLRDPRWPQTSTLEEYKKGFENELLRFGVVDMVVEEKLVTRREEWLCRFVQILEEALTGVVCSNSESATDVPTPLLLDEALTSVSRLHPGLGDRATATLRLACDQVAALFVYPSREGDFVQIKRDMDSKELIRILGAGVILIKRLINLHPACEALTAALERLNQLLRDTRDPGSTPDSSISDFKGKVPYKSIPEDVSVEGRLNVTKKPSEVVEYLKRHFPAWQDYKTTERPNQFGTLLEDLVLNDESNVRIIRTCGRDLGRLKLKPHTITLDGGANQRDDFTSDSGICQSDESQHAKPLINTFLGEISDFFILVCDIVKSTVLEFEDSLLEKRKRVISRKVGKIQRVIVENREKLQSIIRREASDSESTLKMLITKAGVSVSNIKMSRYRQVIMKLLEQAYILDGSLQTIAQLTKGEKVDLEMIEKVCDIKYINIFDALSG